MNAPSSTGLLIDPEWRRVLEPVAGFLATNPFEPAWGEIEKAVLGRHHDAKIAAGAPGKNRERIAMEIAMPLLLTAERLAAGVTGTAAELEVYQRAVLYSLLDDYGPQLQRLIEKDEVDVPFYDELAERCRRCLAHPGLTAPEPGHLLAVIYQAQRTWHFARTKILGESARAMAARAAICRANLGADFHTYVVSLYRRMDEIPVLITGETGTGKDLAAQCVGWSRYIPFDVATRRFVAGYLADFHARNLCEVSKELLESALFGHKRGSFTGATADKTGFFALPGQHGTLFLDEAGELPDHVQSMLLRPLQNREYVVIGETRPRQVLGRIIFATHRDLEAQCAEGTFRADLYERMNGVPIHMPALREMVADAPEELRCYVRAFVTAGIDGPEQVERWTERVVNAIHATKLGYTWPRNLRELKNYTERYLLTEGRMFEPAPRPSKPEATSPRPAGGNGTPESMVLPSSGILGWRAKAGEISVAELIRAYVTWLFVLTGQNRAETARRTGLTWRKVGSWLDPARLARWLRARKK